MSIKKLTNLSPALILNLTNQQVLDILKSIIKEVVIESEKTMRCRVVGIVLSELLPDVNKL